MRDQLLKDPTVQAAMKNAGESALNSPDVQKAIIDAAKNTFTAENANIVKDKVKDWAQDPEVQAKARHYAGMAMVMAGTAGAAFVGVIEQGPAGIRVLAFLGSLASVVLSIFTLINPLTVFVAPVTYAISAYQALFALTTMLFEAKPEWIQKAPGLDKYQNLLIDYCKALTVSLGRGLFYIFQGSMWLFQAEFTEIFMIVTGAFLVLIGIFNILMHFGILPQHLAAKAKEAAASAGYAPAPQA